MPNGRTPPSPTERQHSGFSLFELLIVVFVMAAIMVVVTADLGPDPETRATAAADQVHDALRFARDESIRTGRPHGLEADADTLGFRVFWLDTSGATPVPVYDVHRPVTRKLYASRFEDQRITDGASLDLSFARRAGGDAGEWVAFDASGMPVDPDDLAPVSTGTLTITVGSIPVAFKLSAPVGRLGSPG